MKKQYFMQAAVTLTKNNLVYNAYQPCSPSHGEEATVQFEIFFRVRLIDWMWLTRCLMHLEEK